MSSSPELLESPNKSDYISSSWMIQTKWRLVLFSQLFTYLPFFPFSLKNLPSLKVNLFTLALIVSFHVLLFGLVHFPLFPFSLPHIVFPSFRSISFPFLTFPFLLRLSDRKQLVDITDDDLQPHIHFLSQIY